MPIGVDKTAGLPTVPSALEKLDGLSQGARSGIYVLFISPIRYERFRTMARLAPKLLYERFIDFFYCFMQKGTKDIMFEE
jgi:hypothetical protein